MSQLLNTTESANYLKSKGFPVRPKTLEAWRCMGKGPKYLKISRRVFYRPEFLDEFVRGVEVRTIDPSQQAVRHRKADDVAQGV